MIRPSVVLVGIPGSGKSTIAASLAGRWGIDLNDTDVLVEERTGQTRPEAFASLDGEEAFRDTERRASLDVLAQPGVVALGSGAVESPEVRDALAGLRVVWLQARVQTVTRRLGMTMLGIPALAAIRDALDAQLTERAGWYAAVATEVIDTDRMSPDDVVAAIEAGVR